MDRQDELDMTRDLAEIELREKYERDLLIVNKCIRALDNEKDLLTTKYEQTLLDLSRK